MMIDHIADHLFLYVLLIATAVMAAIGNFLIAPLERRNHKRKLALLQEKIKQHEARMEHGTGAAGEADTDGA